MTTLPLNNLNSMGMRTLVRHLEPWDPLIGEFIMPMSLMSCMLSCVLYVVYFRAVDGKMEKSFINFQKNHPQWHPKNAGGQAVMKSIQSFRDSRIRVRDENMVSMLQQSLMLGPNMSMMGGSGLHMGGVTHAAASVPSKSTVPGTTYVGSRHPAQVAPMPTTRNTQELYHNPSGPPVSSSGRMQSEEGAEFIRDTSAADSETQDAAVGPFADNSVSVREHSPVMRNQDSLGDVHGDQSCSNGIVTPDMSNIVVAPVISLDQLQANEPEYVNSLLNSRPASLPREQQTQESSVPGVSLQRIVSDGINPDGSGGYNGNVINSYMQSNSNLGVDSGTQMQLHSILRSVLKQENIDYENDFYWMDMLQKERLRESTTVRGQKHSPVSAVPRVGSGRLSPPRNFQSFSHNRPVSNDRSRPVQSQQSLLQSGEGSLDQPLLQGHSRPSRGVSSPMGSLLGVFGSQLNVIWEGKADKPDDSVPTRSAGSGHYPHQLPFGGSRYHYGGGGPRSSNRGISPAPLPPRASSLLSPRGDLLGAQSARNRTNTGIGNRNTHSTDEHTALLDNEEEEEEDAIASV